MIMAGITIMIVLLPAVAHPDTEVVFTAGTSPGSTPGTIEEFTVLGPATSIVRSVAVQPDFTG